MYLVLYIVVFFDNTYNNNAMRVHQLVGDEIGICVRAGPFAAASAPGLAPRL